MSKPAGIDLLLAAATLLICGLDTLLPAGRAVIVLLIVVVLIAGRAQSTRRVVAWSAISVVLLFGEYVLRHGLQIHPVWLERRGICLLGFVAAAYVILRNRWLEATRRERAALLEQAGAAIFVRDAQDRIIAWSQGAEALYGWPAQEIIGRRRSDIFPGEPADLGALEAAGSLQQKHTRPTRQGTLITVLSHLATQKDASGRILAILESNTDITERERREAQIRSSEAHFRSIFETAGAAIWEEDHAAPMALIDTLATQGITDFAAYFHAHPGRARMLLDKARVTATNRATVALLQAPGAATLQASSGALLLRAAEDAFTAFLAAEAAGSRFFTAEMNIATMEGETRTILVSATFAPRTASQASVLLSAMDITERRVSETALLLSKEKLARLTRSATLGELTALISSEVEQPIAEIVVQSTRVETLLRAPRLNLDEVNEILCRIIAEARYCAGVVGNVRGFLRRNQKPDAPVSVASLLEAAGTLLARELATSNVVLNLQVADGLPEISSAAGWLEHVMLYIMLNRIQALATAGGQARTLRVGVFRDDRDIVVRFAGDLCPGPVRDAQAEQELAGQNVGLSLCRTSLEARGGRLVLAQGPGADPYIEIVFPAAGLLGFKA